MKSFKTIKEKVICGMLVAAMAAVPGCWGGDALGLEDYQRDLLFGAGAVALALLNPAAAGPAGPAGEQGPAGPAGQDAEAGATEPAPGEPGETGLSCWDLNGDGIADPEEDLNADGVHDALDCQGGAGDSGTSGSTGSAGPAGSTGLDGEQGPQGDSFFDVFIDDFFTVDDTELGNLPQVTLIEEPILSSDDQIGDLAPVAFRSAIPNAYAPGNLVTLRLFLYRTGGDGPQDCAVFRLDAYRMTNGEDVDRYKGEGEAGDGERYLRIFASGEEMVVVDLPLNAPNGLDFADILAPADFLAFELNVMLGDDSTPFDDGGEYLVVGAELFESSSAAKASATTSRADVFLTVPDIDTGCSKQL